MSDWGPGSPACSAGFVMSLRKGAEGMATSAGVGDLLVSEMFGRDLERVRNTAACGVSAGVSLLSVEVAGCPTCDTVLAGERSSLPDVTDAVGVGASVGDEGDVDMAEAAWEVGIQQSQKCQRGHATAAGCDVPLRRRRVRKDLNPLPQDPGQGALQGQRQVASLQGGSQSWEVWAELWCFAQVPKHEGQHHWHRGEWGVTDVSLPRHRLQVYRGL